MYVDSIKRNRQSGTNRGPHKINTKNAAKLL